MSFGNDMMGSFCRQFISEARENPSKLYIMVSSFTKEAMEDALSYLDNDHEERPANIFLEIEDAISVLKAWENS